MTAENSARLYCDFFDAGCGAELHTEFSRIYVCSGMTTLWLRNPPNRLRGR